MDIGETCKAAGVAFLSFFVIFAVLSEGFSSGMLFPGAVFVDLKSIVKPLLDISAKKVLAYLPNGAIMSLDEPGLGISYDQTTKTVTIGTELKSYMQENGATVQETTVTVKDTQTGIPIKTSTTTVTTNPTTMTGTVKTTMDNRGDLVAAFFELALSTPAVAVSVKPMAAKPEVRGNVKVVLRVLYTDGTYKDIEKQITISIVGATLIEKATGKTVKAFQAFANGNLEVVGMGDLCVADVTVSLYVKPYYSATVTGYAAPTTPHYSIPKETTSFCKLTRETGWSTPVSLTVDMPAGDVESFYGEYNIYTSLGVRVVATEYRGTLLGATDQIERRVEMQGVSEGPSISGFYAGSDETIPNIIDIRGENYYGANWKAYLVSGPSDGLRNVFLQWKDNKLACSAAVHVTGTYKWRLECSKGGKWNNDIATITFSTLGLCTSYAPAPTPIPVSGTVSITFNSYLSLSSGHKLLESDTIYVKLAKYSPTEVGYKPSIVWEGNMKSTETKTIDVTLSYGESLSVRLEKSLGSFEQIQTAYGGHVEYTCYDAGDWWGFCSSPTHSVTVKAVVPFDPDKVQQMPEFKVETKPTSRTVSVIPSPDTTLIVTPDLPLKSQGQVPEGTPNAKKLVVEGNQYQVFPPPGIYWFADGSKIVARTLYGVDYATLDGIKVAYGNDQNIPIVMNTDHYLKVYGSSITTYIIDGYVKNGETGAAIKGATVQIFEYGKSWDAPYSSTVTDENGYFRLLDLKQLQSYDIIVSASGFKQFSATVSAPGKLEILLYPPSSSAKTYPENTFTVVTPPDPSTYTIVKVPTGGGDYAIVSPTFLATDTITGYQAFNSGVTLQTQSSKIEVQGKTIDLQDGHNTIYVDKKAGETTGVTKTSTMTADPNIEEDPFMLLLIGVSAVIGVLIGFIISRKR